MTEGRYTLEQHQQYRKQVEAEQRRALQAQRAATKEAARRAWVSGGGSAHTFERAWEADEVAAAESYLARQRELARAHSRASSEF